MKKWLKNLGLAWLTALTLGWGIKEGIAQTTQGTNSDIQWIFAEKKDRKNQKPETYIATAADLKEQEANDSIDVTQVLKDMTENTDQLVDFYGKEERNKKVHQIMEEHPNFWTLTTKQQEGIIQQFFWDFLENNDITSDTAGMVWFLAGLLFTLRMMTLNKSTRIRTE